MSFEEVIKHTSLAPSIIQALTPEKLNSGLTAAQKKYGNPITRAFLGKRMPTSAKAFEEGPRLTLLKILLGEGSADSKGLKYLLLKELGFFPGAADNLSERASKSLFRFILGQLLSADVIRAYSEERFKGQPAEFNEFLDTVGQFLAGAVDARIQFKLSSEAIEELFQQFQNYGEPSNEDPFINHESKPTKRWPIRTFFLWAQSLKNSGIATLDLSLEDLFSLSQYQWQALGTALKNSEVTTLNLSDNGLSFEQWAVLFKALKNKGAPLLEMRGVDIGGFSTEEAQALLQFHEGDCPAIKVYVEGFKWAKGIHESLAQIKNAITPLISPNSEFSEEKALQLIAELEKQWAKIRRLNEIDFLPLYNEYYSIAFLLAKAMGDTDAALGALQAIELSPAITYPGKALFGDELPHEALGFALELGATQHPSAETAHQITRGLFKQVGKIDDYYLARFSQQTLGTEQASALLEAANKIQAAVALGCLPSNKQPGFFAEGPSRAMQALQAHVTQFAETATEKVADGADVLKCELAYFLNGLEELTAAIENSRAGLVGKLTAFIQKSSKYLQPVVANADEACANVAGDARP